MHTPEHDHGSASSAVGMTDGTTHTGMSPYLFIRTTDFFVLFKQADIQSTGAFIAALIVSGLFALVATILSQIAPSYEQRALRSSEFTTKTVGAVLFSFRQFLHYTAMLIVMTMNVWLIIAVIVGHLVGWLLYSVLIHKYVGTHAQTAPSLHKTDPELDN